MTLFSKFTTPLFHFPNQQLSVYRIDGKLSDQIINIKKRIIEENVHFQFNDNSRSPFLHSEYLKIKNK